MYVYRTCFFNVKPLHRCIPDGGTPLPEAGQRRLLLQGANGSGKTTILETIVTLWRFWGEWIEMGRNSSPPEEHLSHYLAGADLAAMQIVGMPDIRPVWIGMGKNREWQPLKTTFSGSGFAGLAHGKHGWEIELPSEDLLTHRYRSLADSEQFPNVVYFPSEGRYIRRLKAPRAEILDTTRFNWTAMYDPAINLDSVLLTVQARFPNRFEECLRLVNLALQHRQKRITGFGPKGRLVVKGTTEAGVTYEHSIEELSSGEQQMLLLVGFVVAFLRPGGIVLIDEPDLHIHIAMVTQLLQTLDFVVRERQGQLIVASHSELVWNFFSREDERVELTPWRGTNS
jgi:ABC-type lipoprotein export system ATPase subunit